MSNTITPTRTYTEKALDAELGRRRNNKTRETPVRGKGFLLTSLSKADMDQIKAGTVVVKSFNSGRVEHVGLKV